MKPHKTIESRYVCHDGENSEVSISENEVLYCWWGQILFSNQDGNVDIFKLGDPLGNMIMDSLTIYISSWYYLGVIFHYRWSKEVQCSLIIVLWKNALQRSCIILILTGNPGLQSLHYYSNVHSDTYPEIFIPLPHGIWRI